MSKLSGVKVVRDLLHDGWKLGYDISILSTQKVFIQQGEIGYGGATHDIHMKTFNALLEQGDIKPGKKGFPIQEYVLTDLGDR